MCLLGFVAVSLVVGSGLQVIVWITLLVFILVADEFTCLSQLLFGFYFGTGVNFLEWRMLCGSIGVTCPNRCSRRLLYSEGAHPHGQPFFLPLVQWSWALHTTWSAKFCRNLHQVCPHESNKTVSVQHVQGTIIIFHFNFQCLTPIVLFWVLSGVLCRGLLKTSLSHFATDLSLQRFSLIAGLQRLRFLFPSWILVPGKCFYWQKWQS